MNALRIKILIGCLFLFYSLRVAAQEATYMNSIGTEFVLVQPGSMVVGRFQPPYPTPQKTLRTARKQVINGPRTIISLPKSW
ncbi:hypothetical protein [Spirosoma sp. KNUC1025]|uniref:hypothetical protein n=1 Tax=Spirosoma sp. KNUC1025 TaxID=2894082 RepID=UPI00386E2C2E|nr:hypothetical protein LN737_02145 [Spirosoma sp. KNUC1025]